MEWWRGYRGCTAYVRCVTLDDGSERTGSSATREASTPSNRRVPAPKSTGESAIENSSTRPAFRCSRMVSLPPAMRMSRSPATSRAWPSALWMPSLTKWNVVPPRRSQASRC